MQMISFLRKIIFFACFIGLQNELLSQAIIGGVQVGAIASQVDGDDHSGYRKLGLFAGGYAKYQIPNKNIALQMELNYAQKGSKAKNLNYKIKTHQIELPFLVLWNFWNDLSLEVGLSCNFLANAAEYLNKERVVDTEQRFHLFELGAIAGVHYCFYEKFLVGWRFNYSLSPIGNGVIQRNNKRVSSHMWNNAMLFFVAYQF